MDSQIQAMLKSEDRVTQSVNMSDTCVLISREGILAEHPDLSEEELINQLRSRLNKSKVENLE